MVIETHPSPLASLMLSLKVFNALIQFRSYFNDLLYKIIISIRWWAVAPGTRFFGHICNSAFPYHLIHIFAISVRELRVYDGIVTPDCIN
jgi:hypothetical protein